VQGREPEHDHPSEEAMNIGVEAFKEGVRRILILSPTLEDFDIRMRAYLILLEEDPEKDDRERRDAIGDLMDEQVSPADNAAYNALDDWMAYERWLKE
jgi:hypothetical protein